MKKVGVGKKQKVKSCAWRYIKKNRRHDRGRLNDSKSLGANANESGSGSGSGFNISLKRSASVCHFFRPRRHEKAPGHEPEGFFLDGFTHAPH